MNITLAIPKGKDVKKRIEKEYSLASNIKDKNNQDSVRKGLKKILEQITDGKVYLWNGKKLDVYDYPLDSYIYYCHPTLFKVPEVGLHSTYLMICVDANECTIGKLRGSKLTTLWKGRSYIQGKHKTGGQSALRFERLRNEMVKQWYRKCVRKLKEFME